MTRIARPDPGRTGAANSQADAGRPDRGVTGWAIISAALTPVLLAGGWLTADALQPSSYSPVRQTVSVLAGYGGTDRWIVTGALLVVGACYFVTAAGLPGVRRAARILLVVAGVSSIGIAACPEPVHGATPQHVACGVLGAVTITIWPAFVGRREPARPLIMTATGAAAVTAVFAAGLSWLFIQTQGGSDLGLAERLTSAIQTSWPFVVAVALRRAGARGTRRAARASRRPPHLIRSPAGPEPASLQLAPVRIVIARCSVDYAGRLSAHLPPATRLLIVKADSSVLVHSDGGSYKPLNWMSPPCRLAEEPGRWVVTGKSGETLTIWIEEILSDTSFDLGVDPGLVKDGVEAHLQELLAAQVHVLGAGWRLVRREFPTPIGPVDLMCRDAAGGSVAIEIKRRGDIDGVEQLTRYLVLLNRDPLLAPVQGIFAAQEIRPQARVLALDRGIRCVTLDYEAMRGTDDGALRLF